MAHPIFDRSSYAWDRQEAKELFDDVRSRNSRQSAPVTMNWLDTQASRFAVLNSTNPDGRLQATYTPADLAALDRHLTQIVRSVS
jgi:hypothetical protein